MPKLMQLIYDTLEKMEKEREGKLPRGHYPSGASFKYKSGKLIGPDLLTQYLKWNGVKPSNPSEAAGILKMKLGDGAHESLARILAKSGVKIMSEVSGGYTDPILEYGVRYRLDHLGEFEGESIVIEVKSSMQQQLFNPDWGIKVTGPKEDHLLQVICYLNVVPGVKKAKLLYIDRGSGGMVEFDVDRNTNDTYIINGEALIPELSWKGVVSRWAELESYLKTKESPMPEYKAWINDRTGEVMDVKSINGRKYKTDWRVMYDPYRDLIWKDPKYREFTYNAQYEKKGA